jgi:hypothetical protein
VEKVTDVCKRPDWLVTIADDQLFTQLLGLALSHVAMPSVPL